MSSSIASKGMKLGKGRFMFIISATPHPSRPPEVPSLPCKPRCDSVPDELCMIAGRRASTHPTAPPAGAPAHRGPPIPMRRAGRGSARERKPERLRAERDVIFLSQALSWTAVEHTVFKHSHILARFPTQMTFINLLML